MEGARSRWRCVPGGNACSFETGSVGTRRMLHGRTFDALLPAVRSALLRRGFEDLTSVQRAVVEADIAGRDLRISSQTGSGKTVALGLAVAPSLGALAPEREGPLAVILAPTRELATQVRGELSWLLEELEGVEVASATGGTDPVRERRSLKRRPTVLVATPGRLLDHVRSGALRFDSVQHVVLDEADQMLDLGFREELDAILEQMPEGRRLHMVSATFAREVLRFADRCQTNTLHLEGTRLGEANEDIEHVAHLVLPGERHGALVNLLLSDVAGGGGSWLVFVRRRADATELAELLVEDGFSAMPFSGELSQAQRDRTLEAFRRGLVKVLVATDVAARGIDVQGVSAVVHFDLPTEAEGLTHRAGRTGRAGSKGRSILIVPPSGERRVRRMLGVAGIAASWQDVPDARRIEKTAIKKTRRALHARLEAGEEVAAKQLAYAQTLLERHDPSTVVAILLEMARGDLPREPVQVRSLEPRGDAPPMKDRFRRGMPPRASKPWAKPKGRRPGSARSTGPRPPRAKLSTPEAVQEVSTREPRR